MAGDIIVIEKELLKSECFRALSGTAKTVYFDFRMKCQVRGVKPKAGRRKERFILNNGEIEYCYSEAEKKGIGRASFMRALDVLIERGFIDCCHSGTGTRKGDKSLYGISDRWQLYGKQGFVTAKRQKDSRKGRGFAVVWQKRKEQS